MSQMDASARQAQRKANVRLGLILGSIALAICVGFMAKVVLFGV